MAAAVRCNGVLTNILRNFLLAVLNIISLIHKRYQEKIIKYYVDNLFLTCICSRSCLDDEDKAILPKYLMLIPRECICDFMAAPSRGIVLKYKQSRNYMYVYIIL